MRGNTRCHGGMKLGTASFFLLLASALAGLGSFACSSSTVPTPAPGVDGGVDGGGGACGQQPAGGTCKKPGGGCEAEVCIGTTWQCPAGDTPVALTPAACGMSGDDGGTCGAVPVGTTCKKPSGGCEAQVCSGGTWQCPAGDTSVALTPMSCDADGG